jgi:PKD repeat protein
MKNFILAFCACVSFTAAVAQNNIIPCYTTENLEELKQKDPSIESTIQAFNDGLKEFQKNPVRPKAVRIIPTVVHVVHTYGTENISKEQIEDQIRILNEDLNRLNADAANTPAPFAAIAADCEVEFRLARIDPNGNCTDGVVRVYSTLTNGPADRDNVKAVSYWPSNKYFNIWVVKNIDNGGQQGTILGYAQFPGWGPATTDGIVVRADYFGSIGTASSTYKGRTSTHEVGHWLGLRHIWGDATCGNDNVADTPPHEAANSGCPAFPFKANNSCGAGANGEMYVNYMDYTNGGCQNMFSQGQKGVIDFVLNGSRANLWSPTNLAATGVDGSITGICPPKADFKANNTYICAGQSVTFSDLSWNGPVDVRNWSFTGGTPSSSSDSSAVITYNNPGTYPVALTVTNGAGNNTKTVAAYINVSPSPGTPAPFYEGFEGVVIPNNNWFVNNPDNGLTWASSTAAGATGVTSARLINNAANAKNVDELISTTYNMSGVTSASISFKVAYAQRSSTTSDNLRLFVSGNCGQTWALRWTQSGSTLATAPTTSSNFIPTATQWKEVVVSNIPATHLTNNFRFKFTFESAGGNNIYLDDINLNIISGIEDINNNSSFNIFPNPTQGNITLQFANEISGDVKIDILDLTGKTIYNKTLNQNAANSININLGSAVAKGMYLVNVSYNEKTEIKKLIIE